MSHLYRQTTYRVGLERSGMRLMHAIDEAPNEYQSSPQQYITRSLQVQEGLVEAYYNKSTYSLVAPDMLSYHDALERKEDLPYRRWFAFVRQPLMLAFFLREQVPGLMRAPFTATS